MPGPLRFAARWILPIDQRPISGGWVEIVDGRVARIERGVAPTDINDLGDVAILPGLVNAHTHLELSWMAGLVPPAQAMTDWIRTLMRVRRVGPPDGPAAAERAARSAAASMATTGTVLVGDISNGMTVGASGRAAVPEPSRPKRLVPGAFTTPCVLREAGLGGVVFHELIGFAAANPEGVVRDAWTNVDAERAAFRASGTSARVANKAEADVTFSVVAHAPYSVSPALVRAIVREARGPLSVHLAESPEEVEFIRTGRGPMRDMLEVLGVWTDRWEVPACDPVEYMERLGYFKPGTLAVHAVHLTDASLERQRRTGAIVVTCPRSNAWVGAGLPRVARWYAAGVPVAIGTDSLASVGTLNLFDELAELRRVAPEVSAAALLESATRVGAQALGFGRDFGTISAGKRGALLAVDVPADVTDVEEYLVSGVPPRAVRRLPC